MHDNHPDYYDHLGYDHYGNILNHKVRQIRQRRREKSRLY